MDYMVAAAVGVTQVLYHLGFTYASRLEKKASNLGIIFNLRNVWTFLFDIFLLGNTLQLVNLFGAIIITGCAICLILLRS